MASISGTTKKGTYFPGIPFVSPSVDHIGSPYIATLTLPGLTIMLLVWLFSTPVNVNAPIALYASTPPQDHQTHADPLSSSHVGSSSHSSSSTSEISAANNQVDKKKKKNKLGGNLPTTTGHVGSDQPNIFHHVGSVDNVEKFTKTHHKPKFPCRICKGDHLLKDCHGIPKVVEVCSEGSQPASSAVVDHAGDKPSTSDNQVGCKKGKVKFPCLLCKEMHCN
jgi:hypothetical protein